MSIIIIPSIGDRGGCQIVVQFHFNDFDNVPIPIPVLVRLINLNWVYLSLSLSTIYLSIYFLFLSLSQKKILNLSFVYLDSDFFFSEQYLHLSLFLPSSCPYAVWMPMRIPERSRHMKLKGCKHQSIRCILWFSYIIHCDPIGTEIPNALRRIPNSKMTCPLSCNSLCHTVDQHGHYVPYSLQKDLNWRMVYHSGLVAGSLLPNQHSAKDDLASVSSGATSLFCPAEISTIFPTRCYSPTIHQRRKYNLLLLDNTTRQHPS